MEYNAMTKDDLIQELNRRDAQIKHTNEVIIPLAYQVIAESHSQEVSKLRFKIDELESELKKSNPYKQI